jgi:anti-sigma-K factor RskA
LDAGQAALLGTVASSLASLVLGYLTARWKHKDAQEVSEPQWFGAVMQGWERELARLRSRNDELEVENLACRVENESLKVENRRLRARVNSGVEDGR